MSDWNNYIESPHLLTEAELKAKPLSEIIELIKQIEKAGNMAAANLKIHLENTRTLSGLMRQINEGDGECGNPITKFKPY